VVFPDWKLSNHNRLRPARAACQGLKAHVFDPYNVAAETATHKDCLAEEAAGKVNFVKCAKNKMRTVAVGREINLG
jgi:hypothetical protein